MMTEMICGAVGALLVLLSFAGGFAAGWWAGRGRGCAVSGGETAGEAVEREQRAFEEMLRYNPDTAYGMEDGLWGGDGR